MRESRKAAGDFPMARPGNQGVDIPVGRSPEPQALGEDFRPIEQGAKILQ